MIDYDKKLETIGQRIAHARKALDISQTELGERCGGWGQTRIGNYEKNIRTPKPKDIEVLSKALGADRDWLSYGARINNTVKSQSNTEPASIKFDEVPLISWIQAGHAKEVEDIYSVGDYEMMIPCPRRYSQNSFALRVVGDSMQNNSPDSFPEGTILLVDPEHPYKNGSFVVAKFPNSQEATFKQLVIDGDRKYLKPLNDRYPIIEIDQEAVICGVVRDSWNCRD